METEGIGRLLLILGGLMMLAGGVLLAVGRIPGLGRLPGDIVIQRDGFTFFFPVVTMILLSVILTVALNVVLRLFNR